MNNQLNFALRGLLIALVASAATSVVESASAIKILDDKPIEFVADTICKQNGESGWQIARTETIGKLVEFFGQLSGGDKLYSCVDLDTLRELQQVISLKNDDVCSVEKINLIDDFHSRYVSEWRNDLKEQKLWNLKAPKLLVKFFIHYAYQVSVVCKASLLEKLSSAQIGEVKPEVLEIMDKEIKDFFARNGSGSLGDINGITLAWRWTEKGIQSDSFTKPMASNGYRRATFATSESKKTKRIQFECRYLLKPIYGSTLLSVIRLIDMGYYLKDEPFANELANSPTLRRLIGTVLICETYLPISVVQDDSLKPGQMNLINVAKAKMYYVDGQDLKLEKIFPTRWQVSLEGLNSLPTVTPDNGEQIVKSLKKNIRKHESSFARAFVSFSDKFISSAGKLFSCSHREKQDFYPGDAEPLFTSIA